MMIKIYQIVKFVNWNEIINEISNPYIQQNTTAVMYNGCNINNVGKIL